MITRLESFLCCSFATQIEPPDSKDSVEFDDVQEAIGFEEGKLRWIVWGWLFGTEFGHKMRLELKMIPLDDH